MIVASIFLVDVIKMIRYNSHARNYKKIKNTPEATNA